MTRKVTNKGLGKAIHNEKRRQAAVAKANADLTVTGYANGIAERQAGLSVLEQSSLEELLATVQMRKQMYAEDMGEAEAIESGPVLVTLGDVAEAEVQASDRRDLMSIPRRPAWTAEMSTEELAKAEQESFAEWRRGLAQLVQEQGFHLTPYERNLDFWRQLWRCVERCDLLVQILDARDPDFYFCRDLPRFVQEMGSEKRLMLLVNKADFLTKEQRKAWAAHFAASNVDALFFSALYELQKQQRVGEVDSSLIPLPDDSDEEEQPQPADAGDDASESGSEAAAGVRPQQPSWQLLTDDDTDVIDCSLLLQALASRLPPTAASSASATVSVSEKSNAWRRGTVGFVGYPNVGKSTVVNALIGAKKVGMSSRPGKTKHIQTWDLTDAGLTLCDCPGLVFPSVVATKAHLVINNTIPLDDLQDCFSPIRLIVQKVGLKELLDRYNCKKYAKEAAQRVGDQDLDESRIFLCAVAASRNHFLRVGVPDENWAARLVLREFVAGRLLYCEPPPHEASSGVVDDATKVGKGSDVNANRVSAEEDEQDENEDAEDENENDDDDEDEDEEEDFKDVLAFANKARGVRQSAVRKSTTKRAQRHQAKQAIKGSQVVSW
mmetsp:Transcript_51582/g.122728  ORF Transcript_51582/g.122728 Transcript_51582/m.122728 type:complete len:608 (+) Transcript_51582:93-1916(+)